MVKIGSIGPTANVRLYEFSEFMLSFRNESWGIAPLLWERKSSLNWIIVFADQISLQSYLWEGWLALIERSNTARDAMKPKGSYSGESDKKMGCFRAEITCQISRIANACKNALSHRKSTGGSGRNSWSHFLRKISLLSFFSTVARWMRVMRHGGKKFISEIYDRESSFLSLNRAIHYSWECTRSRVSSLAYGSTRFR